MKHTDHHFDVLDPRCFVLAAHIRLVQHAGLHRGDRRKIVLVAKDLLDGAFGLHGGLEHNHERSLLVGLDQVHAELLELHKVNLNNSMEF